MPFGETVEGTSKIPHHSSPVWVFRGSIFNLTRLRQATKRIKPRHYGIMSHLTLITFLPSRNCMIITFSLLWIRGTLPCTLVILAHYCWPIVHNVVHPQSPHPTDYVVTPIMFIKSYRNTGVVQQPCWLLFIARPNVVMHPEDTGAVPKHATLYAWAWLVRYVRLTVSLQPPEGVGWDSLNSVWRVTTVNRNLINFMN